MAFFNGLLDYRRCYRPIEHCDTREDVESHNRALRLDVVLHRDSHGQVVVIRAVRIDARVGRGSGQRAGDP